MPRRNTEEIANKVRVDLLKDQLMNKLKALTTDEAIVINQKNNPYIRFKNAPNIIPINPTAFEEAKKEGFKGSFNEYLDSLSKDELKRIGVQDGGLISLYKKISRKP